MEALDHPVFAESLPLAGRPLEDVLARLRGQAIPDSNHLCHPRAMGHQVSAPLPVAVWAESLISALNQSAAASRGLRMDVAALEAALRVREAYNRSGEGWITTTRLGGRRVLRVTVMNPRTGVADVEETLRRLGETARRRA
jgi:glutamate/tyrosine decarboxylase-like PLP-dependent enzyme